MPSHAQKHLPISMRYYRTLSITCQFSPEAWDKLRLRSLAHHASPEGYIKQLLNAYIANNRPIPAPDDFNQLFLTTKHHPSNHPSLPAPYPAIYLRYLDDLIDNLPITYTSNGRSRRRMVETLTLVDLFI